MPVSSPSKRPGRSLVAIGLAAALAGCGTPPAPPPSQATRVTPEPTPHSVVAAFNAIVRDPSFAGHADLSGTLALDKDRGVVTGFIDFIGEEYHSRSVVKIRGRTQTDEVIAADGVVVDRVGNTWFVRESGDSGWPLQRILAETALQEAGAATISGENVTRLVPVEELPANAFGAPHEDGATDLTVFVANDGRPVAVQLDRTWVAGERSPESGTTKLHFSLDLERREVVELPANRWSRYSSTQLPYSAALGVGWRLEAISVRDDVLDLLVFEDGEIQVRSYANLPVYDPAGWDANHRSGVVAQFGAVDLDQPISVASVRGRLLQAHYAGQDGNQRVFIHVSFLRGHTGWSVSLHALAGHDSQVRRLFKAFLETFDAEPTRDNVWGLQPGECFRSFPIFPFGGEPGSSAIFLGGVDYFAKVRCSAMHVGEVVAILGPADVDRGCARPFADYAGHLLRRSHMAIAMILPTEVEHVAPDVGAVCVTTHPSGSSRGSIRRDR